MNTDGRMTRSRARLAATPAPAAQKHAGEELSAKPAPRCPLSDVTNEAPRQAGEGGKAMQLHAEAAMELPAASPESFQFDTPGAKAAADADTPDLTPEGDEDAWDSGRCPAAALLEGLGLEERMLSTPPRTGQAPAPAPHAARAPSGAAGMPLVFDEPSPAAAAAPHAPDTPAPAAPGGAPALGPGQMVAAAGAAGLAAAEGEGAGAAAAATGAPAAGGDEEVLWHGEEHAAPDAAAPMGPLAPVAQAADMAAAGKARDEVDRSAGAGNRWMPKPATPLADLGHAAPRPAPAVVPEAVATRRVLSKIETPAAYDPRSLRQLKKEVRERLQDPEAASGMASGASSQDGAAAGAEAAAAGDEARPGFPTPWATATSELCSALGTLALGAREPLRGLPLARGRHTRFADDGAPDVSPGRLLLRGVPAPAGSHLRFQD